jgi:hypothetical protein
MSVEETLEELKVERLRDFRTSDLVSSKNLRGRSGQRLYAAPSASTEYRRQQGNFRPCEEIGGDVLTCFEQSRLLDFKWLDLLRRAERPVDGEAEYPDRGVACMHAVGC